VIVYFVLGLVAVDAAVASQSRLWQTYDPDDYAERLRGCRRERPELLVVGGSPVSEGIDPNVLSGLVWHGQALDRVYNLGLPGATTSEVWHAVEHGAATPPRLLIYGITASDINDGRDEPHGPRSLMKPGDLPCWIRYRPTAGEWGVRHFIQGRMAHVWSLFYYRNGVRLWAANQVEQVWPELCADVAAEAREGARYAQAMRQNHGYAPRPEFQIRSHTARKAAGASEKTFPFLHKYHVGEHLKYLLHLLDWAEQSRVDIVLVDMPATADLEEKMHREAYATYHDALAQVERSRGVRVLRASRAAVGLSDDDFADLIHLNASGSARLSAWLRRELAGEDTY
jgi:hypothetical protein